MAFPTRSRLVRLATFRGSFAVPRGVIYYHGGVPHPLRAPATADAASLYSTLYPHQVAIRRRPNIRFILLLVTRDIKCSFHDPRISKCTYV